MSDSGLTKSIGPIRGIALMLNVVVGAGLLSLPGLAVQKIGSLSIAAWLVCAVAAAPLLIVFILMGRKYPDSGGVANFGMQAFGTTGYTIVLALFFGAVAFGLPSIALTGGHYAAAAWGGSPHLYAALLMSVGTLSNIASAEWAGRFNSLMASLVLAIIVALLVVGFVGHWETVPFNPPRFPAPSEITTILLPFMMLFFAFTGFEVGASMTGEFRNAKRDIPIAMGGAFTLASSLYIAIAYLSQKIDLSENYAAPFVAIIRPIFGEFGAVAVSITAVLLILANLSAAIWGVSRMLFSAAREARILWLQRTTQEGTPIVAVLTVLCLLLIVLQFDKAGLIGMDSMLALAGQNFLIIYGIASAALIKISSTKIERFIGVIAIVITSALILIESKLALYPAMIFTGAGVILVSRNYKKLKNRTL